MPQKVAKITNSCAIIAFFIVSCAPVSEFPTIPSGGSSDETPANQNTSTTISIAYLRTLYTGAPTRITGEYWICGAVVSDDHDGNFYKTLVIEDDTGGVELKLDSDNIFERFWHRSWVSVRCNGLWINSFGGSMQLSAGVASDGETLNLSEAQIADHLRGDNDFQREVVPRRATFSTLTPNLLSTFVCFDGVQFATEELGRDWAETATETSPAPPYFTSRYLIDREGNRLAVRTSRYASFAGISLPEKSGSITGILGYAGGEYHLVLSYHTDADMRGARF